ncbi:ribonuclease Y [Patescibacteria group bacterium]|jgi:ribonuclease Y|nr:ribonuclease Y [Patescibacteria group bacterium]
MTATILTALAALLVGAAAGYTLRYLLLASKKGSLEVEVKQIILNAKEEAKQITDGAEAKAEEVVKELKRDLKDREELLLKNENRLIERESSLDAKRDDLERQKDALKERQEELAQEHRAVEELRQQELAELTRIAGLSVEDAKQELLTTVEERFEEDLAGRIRKLEHTGREKYEKKAQEIVTSAIHRYGNAVPADVLSTSVSIPNDEVKGKIIGKEGRNIKAFERAAGVEVVIDDTPGTILISAHDPVRRQIARVALENLILDGRIQPSRIEESIETARQEINGIIREKGEQAAFEVGVGNLDPRILMILGRLYFRTSYGQNVLQHSVEMAHIAGMIASEVGADVAIAKAGALVHDIGKAVDHEVAGTHVEIGRRILQKFGADERIVLAMQAHHEEYPYETPESIIVQVADAISGSRPGARRDTVENYIKRLEELEGLAGGFPGVDKAYAIQAGREVRIFVNPEDVGDVEAKRLAREIADKIETDLKYPGEIKVAVIRENRAVEYAR